MLAMRSGSSRASIKVANFRCTRAARSLSVDRANWKWSLIEDMVSRRHAAITINGDELTIADVGSTNGTFVNGEKIKAGSAQGRRPHSDRHVDHEGCHVDSNMTEAEAKANWKSAVSSRCKRRRQRRAR